MIYGVLALTFMMAMYGLESRGRSFVLAFRARSPLIRNPA
jgi:hypothetical protein